VATVRIFDGEEKFRFPTEITEGVTKTRLVYSFRPEQWRELLETCTLPSAQAAIKQVMIPLLLYFRETYPGLFGDIEFDAAFDRDQYAEIVKLK
jgi:thymidylate synthase ThyX